MQKEDIERLRHEVDIVELVSETVPLDKRGKNHIGLCPFHGEKTPSFNVSPERRRYHCFGCGAKGDIFNWVQERERLSFPEALRYLAERAGISVASGGGGGPGGDRQGPSKAELSRIELLRRVCRDAVQLFQDALADRVGQNARNYLRQRGMSRRVIEAAKIGFAPPDALRHHPCRDRKLLTEAGLLMGDRFLFAGRMIIPVNDEQGRPIGFIGRRLPGDERGGKYVNPPATMIYEKNRVLFGLDRARRVLRDGRPLILVEGPLDALALEQYGVAGAVASSGTAFTKDQAALMARRSRDIPPLLLFDGDGAGQEAARKAASLLLGHGLNPRVLTLAPNDDPDSWVRRVGEDEARERIASAPPFLDLVVRQLAEMRAGTIDENSAREQEAQSWLTAMPPGPMANAFGAAVASVLGRNVLAKPRRQAPPEPEQPPTVPSVQDHRPDRLEVPGQVRYMAEREPVVAAVWNTWQYLVQRRYGQALAQIGIELPMIPSTAQPDTLSGEGRAAILRGINEMLRIQAQRVLAYHQSDPGRIRKAYGFCRQIADDAPALIHQVETKHLP